ncbi:undecaprenyl-diphosphate phosphatase [Candidatus Woesebacteria bacterium]|nr:undecaprenyl-diphosphate phosphatase [Candidatus Woesebacteria bacterium]
MNILQSALLGIIEGATEYLPISSTFHLIWTGKLLGIPQTEFQKLFEVVIQSGAILSVVVLFFKTIFEEKRLIKKVLVSFFPTAVVGLLLYKVIKNIFFENLVLQLVVFVSVGVLFIVFEKIYKKEGLPKNADEISVKEAVVVGLVQSLAIIPGVSRAGAVILALMYLGVNRKDAARYSFLLAIPTLLAASGLDLIKSRAVLTNQTGNMLLLTIGFTFSFISALVVVKWFISYLSKHDLKLFGWYRLALAIVLLSLAKNL